MYIVLEKVTKKDGSQIQWSQHDKTKNTDMTEVCKSIKHFYILKTWLV